jgi:hypothetical protein
LEIQERAVDFSNVASKGLFRISRGTLLRFQPLRKRAFSSTGGVMTGHGSKKTIGAGSQGKWSGTGANADMPNGMVRENMVLSNRDKSRHTKARGQSGKAIQTDQMQDHSANRGGG